MARLIVTRDDLRTGARSKADADITLSDVSGILTNAVSTCDTVEFYGDDGPRALKGRNEGPIDNEAGGSFSPDYLARKEEAPE